MFVAEILYAHKDNFTRRSIFKKRATEFIGSINSNGEIYTFRQPHTCMRSDSYAFAAHVHVELPLIVSLFLPTPIFITRSAGLAREKTGGTKGSRVCGRVRIACNYLCDGNENRRYCAYLSKTAHISACIVGECEETGVYTF